MRGTTACRVLASKNGKASSGDIVTGQTGWTERAILDDGKFVPAEQFSGIRRPEALLSVVGMTALTAWVGMTLIGEPKPGQLVVVSAASGATGSIAGQIAKIKGARVVGICGGENKCRWVKEELGFHLALDYKADDFKERFKEATKDRIDVYFDNGTTIPPPPPPTSPRLGGEILEMCLDRANNHARFVECGHISQYNAVEPKGPRNLMNVVGLRIRMQGFIVIDHQDDYPRARKELASWFSQGLLKQTETIVPGGLAAAEHGLIRLFEGGHMGKLIVEVKKPSQG
ncbi:hypothetical protein XA68_13114 [Ophiocordyceps unilateralis]|uniref:Dehydrogenase FUB6 n=1 Tax=Ophiocordyceps unilateralis TaxID=268505 RepID=A0A2A9PDH4_OPHUN|nr:hypothetical protein XA68_13114 [Ophiocordyceps unilateralis]